VKVISQQLRLSATDLSNHLACHHLSVLDLSVARGARKSPEWKSPDLEIIRQLGMEHELAYLPETVTFIFSPVNGQVALFERHPRTLVKPARKSAGPRRFTGDFTPSVTLAET
jgi:hypothetical protein